MDASAHPAAAAQLRATLIGGIAVLLWSLLALFTSAAAGIPPFQMLAMTFAIAFVVSVAVLARRGRAVLRFDLHAAGEVAAIVADDGRGRAGFALWRRAPAVSLLGFGGLFGYHFFYFVALGNAPPVQASLIAFLWPLLIVVFSALLPGERLRWFHLTGALIGLAGAVLVVTGGREIAFNAAYAPGYLAALACALIWSVYSVTNRRFGAVPTEVVGGFCGVVAALGLLCHLLLEDTVTPSLGQGLAVFALGLGPVGLAFFVWDYGTKHGKIQVLGALSYAAPVLSTLALVAFGRAEASWSLALACALVTGGAVLASKELLFQR